MRRLLLLALLFASPVHAYEVLQQNLQPGGFLLARTSPSAVVKLNERNIWVSPQGEFLIGFERYTPSSQTLTVCTSSCVSSTLTLASRTYVTQNVTKIAPDKVTPNAAQNRQIAADNAATAAARQAAIQARNDQPLWLLEGFQKPLNAPTSGVFGSRRTYNGVERSWHKGHDLAAPTGTPIKAPAPGVVRLARNTFMSGNLLMLDHGGGLTTVYAHLSEMAVKVGQQVSTGQVIGKVGTTGRSSGPHLHWGMYWQNSALDPILWVAN
jgi:murein DD-endopeptidase MepM/ murein hydrolase activator NlpD